MSRGALLAALAGGSLAACAALIGVGDVPFLPPDGGAEDVAPGSETSTSAPCDLSKPFTHLVALPSPVNSNKQEFSGFLTDDELTIYLGIGGDLFVSSRSTTSTAWSVPQPLVALNSPVNDNAPFLTADGLRLFFDSRRVCDGCAPSNDIGIWVAGREPDGGFDPPAAFDGGARNDLHPWLNPSGEIMYFAHGSAEPFDLGVRRVAGVGPDPPSLATLNTTDFDEQKPVVTADELTIYFGTNRKTGAGKPDDVWRATRTSKDVPFGEPQIVDELDDPDPASDDVPSWVSGDGCRILIEKTNASTGGSPDLFRAEKPPR
jgi:hypothetical protein